MQDFIFTRRDFLKTSALLTGTALASELCGKESQEDQPLVPFQDSVPYSGPRDGKKWFRGNTHMHTFRSDGRAFPDEAAALYKRLGYNFVVLTDHNSTHEDPDRWVQVGTRNLAPEMIERLEKNFPDLM
ncbi:MAG: PHP domain-containing protein, partial [Thermoguttaceae bacterium]